MNGTDNQTGRALVGRAHLKQSIATLLTTPIGSRVMRRTFGSKLPRLVDAPFNAGIQMDMIAATAEALSRWEPRLELQSVSVTSPTPGQVLIDLTGIYLPDGQPIKLEGIEIK